MPLDFRYHLASLAAIFGALIIGILLGVAVKEGPLLRNQVQELRAEFRQTEALRTMDQHADEFNQRTQMLILRDRLYGRNVALVTNPSQPSDSQMAIVRHTLELAGATVTAEIQLKPALNDVTPQGTVDLYHAMNLIPDAESPSIGDLMTRMAQNIGLPTGQVATVLQKKKLVRVIGNLEKPVSIVVFLGGATEKSNSAKRVDVPFLRGCVARPGMTVAAVETLDSPISVISEYDNVAPITVDNIDRAAGRIALVLAITNGQHGNFGYKKTADAVAPECE